MVVFGAAGSVPKTSRAFVFVVFGFFCSVCSEVRNESILLALCVDAAPRVLQCSGFVQHFCALGLAAIDSTSCN